MYSIKRGDISFVVKKTVATN